MGMIKADFWKLLYSEWEKTQVAPIPGYSLLILTPGDLPFFLKIALEVCARQNAEHLVETLIIPDNRLTSGFADRLNLWAKDYPTPIRMVPQKPLEKLFTRFHKNAHNNCWMQMVRGINAVRTAHALWHDVDLFISEKDFLKSHYETCAAQQLACLGVSKAWDSWFEARGIDYLVGTWEMMLDVGWARSFKPWQHRGHDELVAGEQHTCDITFWPQYSTPRELVGRHEQEWGFVHFNYVTGTYRKFQQSRGSFEDNLFKLLLVRLLIDAYDQSGWVYEVPSLNDLAKGLTDRSMRVTYTDTKTQAAYPDFRIKLQTLIESNLLDDEKASSLSNGVRPFDKAFGWNCSVAPTLNEMPDLDLSGAAPAML
ncbi:hypothetical protein IFO70_14295 [Phormidium tenue FACHB-886]|nr:hypothetical protein [Phormidium tenue FACHB-886]